ncbi:MAG TPA: O-antigen ligase family protein [Patescibacteria group bacterium]|nr:O-antigen ligase family protein [Patescibacteria group bacterium]
MSSATSAECIAPQAVASGSRRSRAASFTASGRILLAALWIAPLALGAVEPWAWPVLTFLALAALASWGVACIRRGEVRIHWSPLYGLGALLLALGLFQLFAGVTQDGVATRNALILLATDFVFFFMAGQLFAGESAGAYRRFGQAVTIYAAALGLLAIFQAFSSRGLIYWSIHPRVGAVFGPYVNRNNYAGLMEILIPVAAAYAFTRRAGDSRRLLAMFAVAIAVASLLLSGSRGGMVALLAEMVVFGILCFHRKRFARWRRYSAVAGALALSAGVALSVWMNPGYLSERIESVASFPAAPEVTLGQRLIVTRDTLHMAWDHRWLGTGLGSFMAVFPRYQSFAGNGIWEHAHDDYAEALAETGLSGGLLLLAGLIVFFRAAFGGLSDRLYFSAGWIQLACALGCCGALVHSLVDFNLHIPANAAWFAVCAGLATTPAIARREPGGPEGGARRA